MQELMTTNTQIQPLQGVETLLDRFIGYIDVKEITKESYFVCLRDFMAWLNENCIMQPQREDIRRYVEYLNTPHPRRQRSDRPSNVPMPIIKMSAGTQARYLRAVKLFFKWTASEGLYPNVADNVKGAKVKADNTKRDPLQKDQAMTLLQSIDQSTITGKRELRNPKGMFMIEELQRVVLQRCTTAREAIQLMGELIKKYGYADSGECLTIADPNEVWHFEVFGEGKDKIGGVWAAVRIPDDHVGVSANIPRISTLNLKDKDHYMASENVFEVAKKLGLWDGKEPFKFWKAYGNKKAFSVREFFILDQLAPSLNLDYEAEELPFSVKPEKQLSATDVMAFLRQTYEGTKWDVTKNLKVTVKERGSEKVDTIISPKANPWMRPDEIKMLKGLNNEAVTQVRNIAVPQCAYSTVIQLRSWLPDAIGAKIFPHIKGSPSLHNFAACFINAVLRHNAPHAGEAIGMDAVNGTPPGGLQSSVLHHSHHKVPTAGNRRNA